MKRNIQLIICAIAAACLFIAFLYIKNNRESESNASSSGTGSPSNDVRTQADGKERAPIDFEPLAPEEEKRRWDKFISEMTNDEKRAKPDSMSMEEWALYVAEHRQDLRKNGTVEFYGKVVDEDGMPLQGVKINAEVSSFEPSMSKAKEQERFISNMDVELVTDKDGHFEVSGITGFDISFRLFNQGEYFLDENTKTGYSFAPLESLAGRGPPHQPDSKHPVVFTLKRKSE